MKRRMPARQRPVISCGIWQSAAIYLRLLILLLLAGIPGAVFNIAMAQEEAQADTPPAHIIVFDRSGSMWGKLQGSKLAKFLAAKDALAITLPKLPAETPLGLVTFGGSCSGASVATPPAAGSQDSILNRIGNLNPKGKGPIALALQRAAKSLPPDTPGSFVLFHDGPDNCRQDPCAVARDIAKRHPRLKINLVSIAVAPAAAQQVQCIAKETGGKVYSALDISAMNAATQDAFSDITNNQQKDPELVAAPSRAKRPASTTDGPPGVRLSASLVDGGPAVKTPLLWLVTKDKADSTGVKPTVIAAEAASIVRRLEPGTYQVTASTGLASGRATISVGKQGTSATRVALNAGQLAFNVPQNGKTGFVTVKAIGSGARKSASNSWLGRSNSPPLIAPAGKYRITYENGLLRREIEATVKNGTTAAVDLTTSSGDLRLSAQTPAGTALNDIAFHIRIDDPAATDSGRNVLRTRAPAPTIRLPAGTYVVTARTQYDQQSKRVVVGANANISEVFTFPLGEISLTAELIGAASNSQLPIVFRISQGIGTTRHEIARSSDRAPKFALPAGKYTVSAELGAGNVKSSTALDITADQKQNVSLQLDAGELTLTRTAAQSGSKYRDVLWEVMDEHGQVVWRTNQLRPTTLLAPGRYTVRNEARGGVDEKVLVLASGAKEVVELGR